MYSITRCCTRLGRWGLSESARTWLVSWRQHAQNRRAHGAGTSRTHASVHLRCYGRVLPGAVQVNVGRCLRIIHLDSFSVSLPGPLSANLSAISLKNSPLCDSDLILSKRVKRPGSNFLHRSSRISQNMSPSRDALMAGSIPSPIHF